MDSIDSIKLKLQRELKAGRYEHTLRVYEMAMELGECYHLHREKVALAALLHDCGRRIQADASVAQAEAWGIAIDEVERLQPILLHQKIGAYIARHEYGVEDEEILEAIRRHSVGGPGLTPVAKAVYLADLVETGRRFPGVEVLRAAAFKSLDEGMLMAYRHTIKFLLDTFQLVHPDCVTGYNLLVAKYSDRGSGK